MLKKITKSELKKVITDAFKKSGRDTGKSKYVRELLEKYDQPKNTIINLQSGEFI